MTNCIMLSNETEPQSPGTEINENGNEDFLNGEAIDDYFKRVMGIMKSCQSNSNSLRGWQDFSEYSGVQGTIARINQQLHKLVSKIFIHHDIKLSVDGLKLTEQLDIIREGNDCLFEKINSELDDASGIRKNDVEILDATVRTIRGPVSNVTGQEITLLASRNIQKPQMFFSPKINNSAKEPFIPLVTEKPNSMKPLSILICLDPDNKEYYSHPYDYELQNFNPPEQALVKKEPILPLEMSQTPYEFVDDVTSLHKMVEELKQSQEIAVDVEHHSFRSYQGLTCLIQISTRQKDFIVDPFPLRNHLQILNEAFTDPNITKVLHGADYDILWLQRDCGVYIVNMFDTHQAAVVLNHLHKSLANLLYTLCSVSANKSYQRADWRIRPLPEDFIHYARQDTHYLLYIHDLLKNELIDKGNNLNNMLIATYNRSTELCLKRYEKPIVGPDSHMDIYRKGRKFFNRRQLYALQQLYLWRDKMARQQDESVDYVLPKHMMLQLAEILPKEMQGILAICNPTPPLIKVEHLTLHQMIRDARSLPLDEISSDADRLRENLWDTNDMAESSVCKHDLTLVEENQTGLSTLLNPHETMLGDLFNEHTGAVKRGKTSALFGALKECLKVKSSRMDLCTDEFMSPYERYKIILATDEATPIPAAEQVAAETASTIDIRINKIKEHFLSLNSTSEPSIPKNNEADLTEEEMSDPVEDSDTQTMTGPKPDLDSERMNRLMSHIASLVTVAQPASESSQEMTKKRKKKKGPATNKKKKKAQAAKEEDGMESDSSCEVKPEGEEETSLTSEKLELFDYAKANFNMFRPKKVFKKKAQRIQERFRAKGSNKPTGWKKSGLKSMSWGNSGNFNKPY